MNVKEILERGEARIKARWANPFAGIVHHEAEAVLVHVRELEARAERAERERDETIKALSEEARKRGEVEGRLEASEMAGVVERWVARAEKAEAENKRLREALEPFAVIAVWDIGKNESDEDTYQPMPACYALGGVLKVKHFRAALEAMEATDE